MIALASCAPLNAFSLLVEQLVADVVHVVLVEPLELFGLQVGKHDLTAASSLLLVVSQFGPVLLDSWYDSLLSQGLKSGRPVVILDGGLNSLHPLVGVGGQARRWSARAHKVFIKAAVAFVREKVSRRPQW